MDVSVGKSDKGLRTELVEFAFLAAKAVRELAAIIDISIETCLCPVTCQSMRYIACQCRALKRFQIYAEIGARGLVNRIELEISLAVFGQSKTE